MTDACGVCGGDRYIMNSFGNQTRCPTCHGTGRRNDEGGLRDVTKTKPSHFLPKKEAGAKQTGPTTFEGRELEKEVQASGLSPEAKGRLSRDIVEHEGTHGKCTQTFVKKIRKQVRPST